MRSAKGISLLVAAGVGSLLLLGLSGCDTTQDAAARLKIRSARLLASREPVKIHERAADVRVTDATIVRGDGEAAVVVGLHNESDQPVTDLPIAVGVRGPDGQEQLLNEGTELTYYQTHVQALAPGEDGTWVFVAKGPVDDGEAFAEVGEGPSPPITTASSLPALDIGTVAGPDGSKATVDVANPLGFPQYDVAVFAWVTKGDRYLAAGAAEAGDLDPDESEPVSLKLIGNPRSGDVHVAAPPTIFQ